MTAPRDDETLRARRMILTDADSIERVTLAIEEGNGGQRELVIRDLHADAGAEVCARWSLAPTPAERETGRDQDAVATERGLVLKALLYAETPVNVATTALEKVVDANKILMPHSDAGPLRRALPRLEKAVANVRALMALAPWPEAEERLRTRNMGETLLADARAVLAQFNELVAAREAAREAARRPRVAAP